MQRVYFIEYNGVKILFIDFSNVTPDEGIDVMRQGREIITKQERKSLLILTDVTKANFDHKSTENLKTFCKNNTPYVKASAVIGVSGLHRIILGAVMKFTGRELKIFSNEIEAKNWLISCAE